MTKDTKKPGERSRAAELFSPSKTGDGAAARIVAQIRNAMAKEEAGK